MATENSSENAPAVDLKPSKTGVPASTLVLPLLNTLLILVAFGLLIYAKFVVKSSVAKEAEESKKSAEIQRKADLEATKVVFYSLDPITVNIASSPAETSDGSRKLHYVNIGIAFETRGDTNKGILESLKPYILDQVVFLLGKKTVEQLSTIQGRYVLQSQIQDATNLIVSTKLSNPPREAPVLHTYFNQLVVQ